MGQDMPKAPFVQRLSAENYALERILFIIKGKLAAGELALTYLFEMLILRNNCAIKTGGDNHR